MSAGKGNESILDAVLEVSRKQAQEMVAMRTAFEMGDERSALEHAKILVGIQPVGRKTVTA